MITDPTRRTRDVLRFMAWERAKGELRALLQTFYSDGDEQMHLEYLRWRERINTFIKAMDGGYDISLDL
jgi:hypothetical protein